MWNQSGVDAGTSQKLECQKPQKSLQSMKTKHENKNENRDKQSCNK